MKSKKSMSGAISAVLLIAITISIVAVVWGVVNNLVLDKTRHGEACSDIFGKIEINGRYTCYNNSGSTTNLRFSINRKDIDLDSILVSIESQGKFKTVKIADSPTEIDNMQMFNGDSDIKLPEKNGGETYIFDYDTAGFSDVPDAISVAPIINGETCSEIAQMQDIENCNIFVFS